VNFVSSAAISILMIKVNKPFFLNWAYGLQQEGTADGARDFLLKIIRTLSVFHGFFSSRYD
jgi:hypothetical protein